MTLLQKQQLFPVLLAKLFDYIYSQGYCCTLGEAHRPPETAKIYAERGLGIANSLHTIRLAIDINLFIGKKYLTKTEDYKFAGEFWESLSTQDYECIWGGSFGDADHFSIAYQGIK